MLNELKSDLPWPGLTFACVRILQLYCKVFEQPEQCFKNARYV